MAATPVVSLLPAALVVGAYALLTALATGLGALPFRFVGRDALAANPERGGLTLQQIAGSHAVAAGLMLGATIGLVTEGFARGAGATLIGAVVGVLAIVVTDKLLGDHDHAPPVAGLGGVRGAGARRVLLFLAVMTVHSFAEGAALGVSFGGGVTLGLAITLAIAVHNIPEGIAITAVMRPQGASLWACARWSIISSLPQPLAAIPAFLLVERVAPVMPYGFGFAAGAMAYLCLAELLPEAYEDGHWGVITALTIVPCVAMILFQRALG